MKNFSELLKNFKKLWPYAKKYKKEIMYDVIAMFFLSVISLVTPLLGAKLLIDITEKNFNALIQTGIIIFFIEILRNTFNFIASKYFAIFFHNSTNNLGLEILKKALALESFEIDNNSSGVIIDRINKDTRNIPGILDKIEKIIFDVMINVGILVTVFVINKILFIYILLAIVIIFFIEKIAINKRYAIEKSRRINDEKVTSLIGESFRGIRDIKVLNADLNIMDKTKEVLSESVNKFLQMNKIGYRYRFLAGGVKDLYQLFLIHLHL